VESEQQYDPLNRELLSRSAMLPSARFTSEVLARIATERKPSPSEEFIAAYGVRAGAGAAALGVWLGVDGFSPASILTPALAAPYAQGVVAIVVICLMWVLMRHEPEGEAL
jgi:hypothetical protein